MGSVGVDFPPIKGIASAIADKGLGLSKGQGPLFGAPPSVFTDCTAPARAEPLRRIPMSMEIPINKRKISPLKAPVKGLLRIGTAIDYG